MDYIVHGVAKSQTQLSDFHFTSYRKKSSFELGLSKWLDKTPCPRAHALQQEKSPQREACAPQLGKSSTQHGILSAAPLPAPPKWIWSMIWKNNWEDCRGRSALRDPICYSFLLCAVSQGFSIPYQFLENRSEKSSTQFSGLRSWERAPAWIPFSDSLQWPYLNVICSVMPLVLKIVNAFWPFEDCYLLGFVFVLFFFFTA